jgi:hypothetical protein
LLGILLVLHSLAHSGPGEWGTASAESFVFRTLAVDPDVARAIATLFWAVAGGGLIAAGLGALGAHPFDRVWRRLGVLAALASLLFLGLVWPHPLALPGATLDAALILLLASGWFGVDGGPTHGRRRDDRPDRVRVRDVFAGTVVI